MSLLHCVVKYESGVHNRRVMYVSAQNDVTSGHEVLQSLKVAAFLFGLDVLKWRKHDHIVLESVEAVYIAIGQAKSGLR